MIAPPKPPQDELEALIREARERQLRRRLLGAVALVVAAAIGLGVYGFTLRGRSGSHAQSSRGPGGVPLCRSSQLGVSSGFDAGIRPISGGARLVNRSGSACSLPGGLPSLRIVWRGNVLPARERETEGIDGGPAKLVRVLQPGASAYVVFGWQNWCGPPKLPAILQPTFDLRFRNGLAIPLRPGSTPRPRCMSASRPAVVDVSRPFTAGSR